MTDPTERHMAEARRIVDFILGPETLSGGDTSIDVGFVAAVLAAAERRGAEAQREADKMTISGLSLTPYGALRLQGSAKGWGKAIEAIVKAVDAAPLATAAPEPKPAADVRAAEQAALALGINVLKHYLETGPCGNFPERAVLESGLATDLPLELTALGRRLLERGGREG